MTIIDPNEIKEFIRTKEHLVPYVVDCNPNEDDSEFYSVFTSKDFLVTEHLVKRWNNSASLLGLSPYEYLVEDEVDDYSIQFWIRIRNKQEVLIDTRLHDNEENPIDADDQTADLIMDDLESLFNMFTLFDIPWR